jgi:hypothetical protein
VHLKSNKYLDSDSESENETLKRKKYKNRSIDRIFSRDLFNNREKRHKHLLALLKNYLG